MSKIKVGVIGAGSMGKNHIRVYKELFDKCELVGFYDIDGEKADAISAQFHTNYFQKPEALLENVEAVSVATPTNMHFEYGLLCAKSHKHVLMEKPLAQNPIEAVEIIRQCQDNDVVLQVGHIERFNPAVIELSHILKGQELISLDFQRLSPFDKRIQDTDVVKDLMIHDIDIMYSIAKSEVEAFYAQGKKVFSESYTDFAQALVRFQNGILASITASRVTEDKVRILTINTKNACIYVDYINKSIKISRSTSFKAGVDEDIQYKQENIIEKVYVQQTEPLKAELSAFLDCIQNGKKPMVGGIDGLRSLVMAQKISDMIRLSDKGGQAGLQREKFKKPSETCVEDKQR